MRMSCAFLLIALVTPASAAEGESYNKQDSAGLAAYFASGGVLVNPTGVNADIAKLHEGRSRQGSIIDALRKSLER
jgi:hypothetical protein